MLGESDEGNFAQIQKLMTEISGSHDRKLKNFAVTQVQGLSYNERWRAVVLLKAAQQSDQYLQSAATFALLELSADWWSIEDDLREASEASHLLPWFQEVVDQWLTRQQTEGGRC